MTTQTIALLGATGRTGRLVIAEARARGLGVRALARDPSRLDEPGVQVLPGDVYDEAALAALFAGSDAVVSALGTPGIADGGLHVRAMPAIVGAMRSAGLRRYVALSSAAARLPGERSGLLHAALLGVGSTALPRYFADKRAEVEALVQADLDYTLLRVAGALVDGSGGEVRTSATLPTLPRSTQRSAVARALIDAVVQARWVREAPFVTGA